VIAFSLPGGIPVYYYSILVGLGAITGIFLTLNSTDEKSSPQRLDICLWALAGSLVGSRLSYVITYWGYFQGHLAEIPQVQLGGLAWFGGIVGWFFGLGLYSAFNGNNLGDVSDAVLPLAACLVAAIWIACWIDGIAYGPAVNTWWALPGRDEWGGIVRRIPLQITAALSTVALFWLLDGIRDGKRFKALLKPGRMTAIAVSGIGMQLVVISLLRTDASPTWRGMRLDVWLSILVVAGVIGGWLFLEAYGLARKVAYKHRMTELGENRG
jgi:prolipoprotein diacylglyceryltransferase